MIGPDRFSTFFFWQAALDDLLATDCPLCGEIMIKSTEKPFVNPNEIDTIRSWEL